MMTIQTFHPWEPVPDVPETTNLESLRDDQDGFNIVLRVEDAPPRYLCISFEGYVSYRSTDEGDLLKTIGPSLRGNTLFTVENSEYLAWLHDQSLGTLSSLSITHFAIYTLNACIDVLSITPPTVQWTAKPD